MNEATLGERIKRLRQAEGLSQEKLAEQLGVSRQAVAKWESGVSAPNTENLFRLAGLFGTTVDLLLPKPEDSSAERKTPEQTGYHAAETGTGAADTAGESVLYGAPAADPAAVAEQLFALQKQEQERQTAARRARRRQNRRAAAQIAAVYLLLHFVGRMLWCDLSQTTVMGWLFTARPRGEGSYLFGWLLHNGLYWWCMGLSVGLAYSGKRVFAGVTVLYFAGGLVLGVLLGPVDTGTGEYGWAYWLMTMLAALPIGAVLQCASAKGQLTLQNRRGRLLTALVPLGVFAAVLLTYLLIPDWTMAEMMA